MQEKEAFHFPSIPEDTFRMASARSNFMNSPMDTFLNHTVFDYYENPSGFRVKKVLFMRVKLTEEERKLRGQEKEEALRQTRKGFILRIEHNQRGDFFFVRIKPGSDGEFNYISRAKVGEDGKKRATIIKEHKGDRTNPEIVDKNLQRCLVNCYQGVKTREQELVPSI